MPSPQVLPQHRRVDYKKRTGLAGGWKISAIMNIGCSLFAKTDPEIA
jgi:hypothetical protein